MNLEVNDPQPSHTLRGGVFCLKHVKIFDGRQLTRLIRGV